MPKTKPAQHKRRVAKTIVSIVLLGEGRFKARAFLCKTRSRAALASNLRTRFLQPATEKSKGILFRAPAILCEALKEIAWIQGISVDRMLTDWLQRFTDAIFVIKPGPLLKTARARKWGLP